MLNNIENFEIVTVLSKKKQAKRLCNQKKDRRF